MKKIKYTKETLVKFTIPELQKICKYYGIEYLPSWSRSKLVKAITSYSAPEISPKIHHYSGYDYVPPSAEPIINENKKSTRIQRIEERKGK